MRAAAGQSCETRVQFAAVGHGRAEGKEDASEYCARVEIKTGYDVRTVTFDVGIDSRNITFSERQHTVTFEAQAGSSPLIFGFTAPQKPGQHDVFIEVSQKNRLIQVIPISIIIADASR
jgi:hypothetical protein